MKSDPMGLSVLRFIQRYADAKRDGLTPHEAKELLMDKQRSENSTIIPKEEQENEQIGTD